MSDRRDDLTVPMRVLTRPGPAVRSASLTTRAVLVGVAVALISVFVTALIAVPLAARQAEQTSQQALVNEADAIAFLLRTRLARLAQGLPAAEPIIIGELRIQGVEIYVIDDGVADRAGLPQNVIDEVASGQRISRQSTIVAGRLSHVEGRPLPRGDGIVMAESADTGVFAQVLRIMWLPLVAGLVAGAIAGTLLGRRLARPIRNAAIAAQRLSSGDRAVRLAVQPPMEVERLAHSMNNLAEALATSEGRQREFLLSISHELRTPLTSIRGYAEALADEVVAPNQVVQTGQTILEEAQRLDRLVADLLSLARLEAADFPVHLTDVDLVELAEAAVRAYLPRCEQHAVSLRVCLPQQHLPVSTDPGRLRQILDGLVENALRVVPPGQPIVLAVRVEPAQAVIEVRDGGPGLTDEDLAVVFERGALYRRYQGIRKVGSGLGLALAHRLAKRLGAAIEAGHAQEGGARFTIYLPRTSS